MLNPNLINTLNQYFETHKSHDFVVSPSIPILYFGDEDAYRKSAHKVITVGKNPSLNEFCKNSKSCSARQYDIKHKFPNWNGTNLTQVLNDYFKQDPLKQWFSSFEHILKGLKCSYYPNTQFQNIALHTDICSPLATNPTWSKLTIDQKNKLYKDGLTIWKELIEELKPDIMFISVPKKLFVKVIHSTGREIISFDKKIDGMQRKKAYKVYLHEYTLNSGKNVKVIFGQAANKPFDTISIEQKTQIGALCQQ